MGGARQTWRLETGIANVPGGTIVSPKGRIGSVTARAFADALAAARHRDPCVVIDFEGVDYISSAGVRVFTDVATNGGRTIVCGLSEPVRITLELAGVLNNIELVPNREAALDSLITRR